MPKFSKSPCIVLSLTESYKLLQRKETISQPKSGQLCFGLSIFPMCMWWNVLGTQLLFQTVSTQDNKHIWPVSLFNMQCVCWVINCFPIGIDADIDPHESLRKRGKLI